MATNHPDLTSPDPMHGDLLLRDPIARAGVIGAGLVLFLCGAGWALYGDSIFLQTLAAGIANCF